MLIFLIVFLLAFLSSCTTLKTIKPYKNKPNVSQIENKKYKMVWNDEFNYSGKPDKNKWTYDKGCTGWGNNELQEYTNSMENVRVENGSLIIEARKKSKKDCKYTSGRIKTKHKVNWLYGRVEVKAKLPKGSGTWAAIWMLPTENVYGGWPASGEIDIMEHVGNNPNVIFGTIHTEAFNHTKGNEIGDNIFVPTAFSGYHLYAIEWSKDKIDFFVDSKMYFTFEPESKSYREWPFNKKFYILLNLAVGGNFGGIKGVDDKIFPVRFLIDYIRVFQKRE